MGITAEYATQVRLTQAFIDTDPEVIVVTRRERVRNPDTGALEWVDGVPQDPQTVRLMEYNTVGQVHVVTTPGGEAAMPDLYLMALPDANIREGDVFDWKGLDWKVDHIHMKPDYEMWADVIRNV